MPYTAGAIAPSPFYMKSRQKERIPHFSSDFLFILIASFSYNPYNVN